MKGLSDQPLSVERGEFPELHALAPEANSPRNFSHNPLDIGCPSLLVKSNSIHNIYNAVPHTFVTISCYVLKTGKYLIQIHVTWYNQVTFLTKWDLKPIKFLKSSISNSKR